MIFLFAFLAGLLSGVISGFGIGGGTLLLLYLTFFAGYSQRAAQGLNLLYFLPTALAAVLLHSKNRLVDWRKALPAALGGCLSAGLFALLSTRLQGEWLQKLFGAFLIVIAFLELRWHPKENHPPES